MKVKARVRDVGYGQGRGLAPLIGVRVMARADSPWWPQSPDFRSGE